MFVIEMLMAVVLAIWQFLIREKKDKISDIISYISYYFLTEKLTCSFLITFCVLNDNLAFVLTCIILVMTKFLRVIFHKYSRMIQKETLIQKILLFYDNTIKGFPIISTVALAFLNLKAYELSIILYMGGCVLNYLFDKVLTRKTKQDIYALQDVAYLFAVLTNLVIFGSDIQPFGIDCVMFMTMLTWVICLVLYMCKIADTNEGTTFWALQADWTDVVNVKFRKKRMLKRMLNAFLPFGFVVYSLLIENTIDFYYANKNTFEFKVADFWGTMIVQAILLSALIAVFMTCWKSEFVKSIGCIVFGIGIASYAQVMFLNRGIRITDNFVVEGAASQKERILNLLIWSILILLPISIYKLIKNKTYTIIKYIAGVLLMIQGVASVFLLVKCGGYNNVAGIRPVDYYISGENEFSVSSRDNIVIFILDTFSSDFYDCMIEKYPDAMDAYSDFTYYNNYNSKYDGTALALNYLFTGIEFDNTVPCREYGANAFKSEKAQNFYSTLHDHGYTCNIYTDKETCMYIGKENLYGIFDNIVREYNVETIVDRRQIRNNIFKGSLFKSLPLCLKQFVSVQTEDFMNLVDVVGNVDETMKLNNDFYQQLKQNDLNTTVEKGNFKIFHFDGMHDYGSGEYGTKDDIADAAYKNLTDVYSYIEKMKECDTYDAATIIILGDHGKWWTVDGLQPIFLIKEAYASNKTMQESPAPISADEFMPTILDVLDEDYSEYGNTIYEIAEDQDRQRTAYVRQFTDFSVPRTISEGTSLSTFWALYGYTYTGNKENLRNKDEDKPDIVLPLIDFWH